MRHFTALVRRFLKIVIQRGWWLSIRKWHPLLRCRSILPCALPTLLWQQKLRWWGRAKMLLLRTFRKNLLQKLNYWVTIKWYLILWNCTIKFPYKNAVDVSSLHILGVVSNSVWLVLWKIILNKKWLQNWSEIIDFIMNEF